MTSVESLDIRAKLIRFIRDSNSLVPFLPSSHQYPLIILYSQIRLGPPLHHITLRDIEAGRETPKLKAFEILLRGTTQGLALFQITFHNRNLKDCILIKFNIFGGAIWASQLTGYYSRKKALGGYDLFLRTAFVSYCRIESDTIPSTKISDTNLEYVDQLRYCTIENKLAIFSPSYTFSLMSCGVSDSKLDNCTSVDRVKDPVLVSILSFRRLPAEIRRMIFAHAVEMVGLRANLIAALRPDPLLYGEVLEAFYQQHVFVLSNENQETFKTMSETKTRRINKIYLKDVGKVFYDLFTDDPTYFFPVGTRITSITAESRRSFSQRKFLHIVERWLKYFGTVVEFIVVYARKERKPWFDGSQLRPLPHNLTSTVGLADIRLGTKAIFDKGKFQENIKIDISPSLRRPGFAPGPEFETFTWTWLANKGSVLRWSSI